MISEEEIKHIAKLSRLEFSESQLEKFQKEFSAILEYVENLKKADTKNVEPMAHSIKVANVFRTDCAIEKGEDTSRRSQKLLEAAPDSKDGYLKSKAVF
ncbi:MAG: Asp-tRNA(Asn)/Glu-tRNA(Gln) amidotransferase subunit GatC [Candidatus Paceibacterota bacterium]|jgi:aspartyl-tRNA(Asn)/glutamyl-tRNA(Gln) amidotransferase subunit C|nr:Asp-tRNA(Asn)/Glu-tRNA(Gln) amidotransferase subunit GatC [Candidatus Paceibacterota bacterium]MDD4830899.1 Asp-tRNA(Asn)/Glu-tRNA(Gln) amidotransferase subunit GatC [Candidatus Paceibacterota bacterium]MDD4875012.1 Asp-tRNA(Asn)/Glu-tRNA(Gln) amidotransferase subunit GatC [Candidatus Paceibacterota bacterium]